MTTALPPCENAPVEPPKQKRRTFMVCKDHGRVVARVYERRNRVRRDGTVAVDRVKICPYCSRLNHKTWYLFGGREVVKARKARYFAIPGNREREIAQQRARRARARLAVAAMIVVMVVASGELMGREARCDQPSKNPRVAVMSRPPAPSFPSRKPRVVGWRFDPCRVSPFFCGYP